MTDLEKRVAEFREKWPRMPGVPGGYYAQWSEDFLSEIKWARKNPPCGATAVEYAHGWQAALDHLRDCLGKKENGK